MILHDDLEVFSLKILKPLILKPFKEILSTGGNGAFPSAALDFPDDSIGLNLNYQDSLRKKETSQHLLIFKLKSFFNIHIGYYLELRSDEVHRFRNIKN